MFLSWKDLVVTPILLIILFFFIHFTNKKKKWGVYYKIYYPALWLKIFGGISLGLIYQFYYNGGDTTNYFNGSSVIYNSFFNNPIITFKLIFSSTSLADYEVKNYLVRIWNYFSESEYFVIRVAGLISLFTFNTYTSIAIFFAIFSFLGNRAIYRILITIYPKLYKEIGIAIFFVPSVFFWGSGIMKDSLAIGALGFLFYSSYMLFVEKKVSLNFILLLVGSFFILYIIKIYILLCFLPCLVPGIILFNNKNIKNRLLRFILKPVYLFFAAFLAYYFAMNITAGDERYDITKVAERTRITAEYIYYVSVKEEGSSYYLGELDGGISSMIKLAPQAIFVSLFRPFLWEVKNPVMLFSALESLIIFIFTIYVLFKLGIIKSFYIIAKEPFLITAFSFSLIFAFTVGINSYNFGTLVRYKIPLVPFYLSGLFILKSFIEKKKQVYFN